MRSKLDLALCNLVRMSASVLAAVVAVLFTTGNASAQTYHFSTLAGFVPRGSNDGPSDTARFSSPSDVTVHSSGNVYVVDAGNHTIRKITPAGIVSTFAGSPGLAGSADGTGTAARFNGPAGIAVDASHNLYVTDAGNGTIRKITSGGVVTTLAGTPGQFGYVDATGSEARFGGGTSLRSIAVEADGTAYVTSFSSTVRKITLAGVVTTLAGSPNQSGFADGTGTNARFSDPRGIAVNAAGTVFVIDRGNNRLRQITSAGVVTTLVGGASSGSTDGPGSSVVFFSVQGLAIDAAGTLYVSQLNRIARITMPDAVVGTLAGEFAFSGNVDGTGSAARFASPSGLAVNSAGNLYVTDTGNHAIRRVTSAGVVSHVAGGGPSGDDNDGTGSSATFRGPRGIAVNASGTVYVGTTSRILRQITGVGVVTTLAGRADWQTTLDGDGIQAAFSNSMAKVGVDGAGVLYIAEGNSIRRVTPVGAVTTLAGHFSSGSADGIGPAARFSGASGIVVAPNGMIYVTETGNRTIRVVTPDGVVTTLAGMAGQSGSTDGVGTEARFSSPQGITADSEALYVADNSTVRKVTYNGTVTTLAGAAGQLGAVDGMGNAARFRFPSDIATDGAGTLFVADTGNNTIRRVTTAGVVSTVAGLALSSGSDDGPGGSARFWSPAAIAVGRHGTLYVADRDNHVIRVGVVADTDVVTNGDFASGTSGWLTHALPDASGMTSNVTSGVLQFYRTGAQAVAFQETGLPLPAQAPIQAQFQLGNSSSVRKRVSVLVHDNSFQDLSACTFFLPANSPLTTYTVRTRTTQRWGSATVSFYAASVGSNGGFYRLDDVEVKYTPEESATQTTCIDPLAPTAPGGVAGPNLVTNGSFGAGATGWFLNGSITHQVAGGVFEFVRPSAGPAALIAQDTGQVMTANQILTATFQLGNSSGVRKRVTALVHDSNFSDLSACTFWLEPGQPLSNYTYRTFATQTWANAMISFYGATVGPDAWIRLDNVTLQRTPGTTIGGTECIEPSIESDIAAATAVRAPVAGTSLVPGLQTRRRSWDSDGETGWLANATEDGRSVLALDEPVDLTAATAARLTLQSWLSSVQSRATIEVSMDDGATWEVVHVVAPSDTWSPLDIDLAAYLGERLLVRFVFDAVVPLLGAEPDTWRIEDVRVESD